jgi:hypothetical protein
MVTGEYIGQREKHLLTMGIVFDGDYRENIFQGDLYYIARSTQRIRQRGVILLQLCLNTNPSVTSRQAR